MQPLQRSCKFVNADNCSVVRIIDNEVYLFNDWLFHVENTPVDHLKGIATFFRVRGQGRFSINQDPQILLGEAMEQQLSIPLNIAYEVFAAYQDINEENRRRLTNLSHKT